MPTHLALVRGINVGATRQVPMADLRARAEGLGLTQVSTYIQSGNLVFDDPSGRSPRALAEALEGALAAAYPFAPRVLVRTADQWRALADDRPFGGWRHDRFLSVGVLDRAPAPEAWAALAPWRHGDDEVELLGDRLWIKTPNGQAATRFTNAWLEARLGVVSTARNLTTVGALLRLLGGATPGS